MPRHIDHILDDWEFDPNSVKVRRVRARHGRDVLQMRVDLGVLQLEIDGRPDGARQEGFESYYDLLLARELHEGDHFTLSETDCQEIDREFVQYHHRRICWLKLQEYDHAAEDADHTLALMDFCRRHSPDDHWTMTHEQYRPFVLLHRTQAAAMAKLEDGGGVDLAVAEVDAGLHQLHDVFVEFELEERFEEDDIVLQLREFRESLMEQFDDRFRLAKQLEEAVAEEQYERAAEIRDEIRRLEAASDGASSRRGDDF